MARVLKGLGKVFLWFCFLVMACWATMEGNRVTIHNIRNADYRTETDCTARYYGRTFDMAKMRSVDLFVIYWGSPFIAHTMLSFGFAGGEYVCFSIETRKEVGEEYSAII